MEFTTIKIEKWSEYQIRKDRAKHHWFRFENDFFESPKFSLLNIGSKFIFIYLMCQASKQQKDGVLILDKERLSFDLKINLDQINTHLQDLESIRVISIGVRAVSRLSPTRHRTGTKEHTTIHNNTIHNNTLGNILPDNASLVVPKKLNKILLFEETKNNGLGEEFTKKLESILPSQLLQDELIKIEVWVAGNPGRDRRTARGWMKFITRWMNNALDKKSKYETVKLKTKSISDEVLNGTYGK